MDTSVMTGLMTFVMKIHINVLLLSSQVLYILEYKHARRLLYVCVCVYIYHCILYVY